MHWLIEEDIFDENYLTPMIQTLEKLGVSFTLAKYIPFSRGKVRVDNRDDFVQYTVPSREVIVYGSINLLKSVEKYTTCIPGAGVTWEHYKITNYLGIYDKYLLNRHGTFMLLSSLKQRAAELLKETMFIKPNTGDKVLVGGPYNLESFSEQCNKVEGNPLVYLAPTRNILWEWRIFCVGDKIITGSQYRKHGKKDVDSNVPFEVYSFINSILYDIPWRPDPAFVLDIAYCHDDQLYIVEPGPFSCAGFYGSDIPKLITAIHNYYLQASTNEKESIQAS
jgi:hypothetical protein